jgi:hypothetical protein
MGVFLWTIPFPLKLVQVLYATWMLYDLYVVGSEHLIQRWFWSHAVIEMKITSPLWSCGSSIFYKLCGLAAPLSSTNWCVILHSKQNFSPLWTCGPFAVVFTGGLTRKQAVTEAILSSPSRPPPLPPPNVRPRLRPVSGGFRRRIRRPPAR